MPKITTLTVAEHRLFRYIPKPAKNRKYTLETMRRLMAALGNPQNSLKIVHIAGTSGKTSTAYYTAAMLQQLGFSVGLTVSPHVDRINERVQINLKPLAEASYCRLLSQFLTIVEKSNLQPTYFEVLVAFAYWVFAKKQVDYAVVEVGLGGLLDGTNVVNREDKICVITDIGLDHTEILGHTLEKIAYQKAGIIQRNNHVFMFNQDPTVMQTVQDVCTHQHATLHRFDQVQATPAELPHFQQRNWQLAAHTVMFIAEREGKQKDAYKLRDSIGISIPARLERVQFKGKTIVFDGSHNPQKLAALLDGMHQLFPKQPIAMLISLGNNKTAQLTESLQILTGSAHFMLVTTFQFGQDEHRQAIKPERIIAVAKKLGYRDLESEPDPVVAFQQLVKRPEPVILVTGSFYLLNHVRPLIVKA